MPNFSKSATPVKIYRQASLINLMSEKTGYTEAALTEVMAAMEDALTDMLFEACPETDVVVYPFSGLSIKSEYKQMRMHSHPKIPEGVLVPENISLKASLTKDYKQRKIQEYRIIRDSYAEWKKRAEELGYSTELKGQMDD